MILHKHSICAFLNGQTDPTGRWLKIGQLDVNVIDGKY